MSPSASPRDLALLFVLASIWGASYMLIKVAVASVPPVTIAAARILIAALVLVAVVGLRGERLPRGARAWWPFVVLAVVGNAVPFTLIGWGELRIGAGLGAILTGVMPLGTVLLAHVFTSDERFTATTAAGLALGFAGIVVLVGPDALAGLGDDVLAQLAVVAAALCYAAATVYARRLKAVTPTVTAAATMAAAAALMVPFSLVFDAPWRLAPDAAALASVAALGVVSTAGASLIYFGLVRSAGATVTSLVNYLIPPIGVLWGVLVLGEKLTADAIAALALILCGIAAINRQPRRGAK